MVLKVAVIHQYDILLICLVKYEDYEETFFLTPDVGIAVLVCFRPLLTVCGLRWWVRSGFDINDGLGIVAALSVIFNTKGSLLTGRSQNKI